MTPLCWFGPVGPIFRVSTRCQYPPGSRRRVKKGSFDVLQRQCTRARAMFIEGARLVFLMWPSAFRWLRVSRRRE